MMLSTRRLCRQDEQEGETQGDGLWPSFQIVYKEFAHIGDEQQSHLSPVVVLYALHPILGSVKTSQNGVPEGRLGQADTLVCD